MALLTSRRSSSVMTRARNFDERDVQEGNNAEGDRGAQAQSFRSAIVPGQALLQRYFGGRNPLGARVGIGGRPDTRAEITIVGVVRDFSYRGLRRMDDQAFFPLFSGGPSSGGFYARMWVASPSAFASIRAADP
jgi:hypothetical protein